MTEKTKKILSILAFAFFVILAAFFIWFLFFKTNKDSQTPVDNNSSQNGNNTNNGGLTPSGNNTNNGKPIDVNTDNNQGNNGSTSGLTPDQIKDIINKNNGQDLNNIIKNTTGNNNNITDLPSVDSNVANGGNVKTNVVVNFPNIKPIVSGNALVSFNTTDGGFYKTDPVTGKTVLLTEDKFKGAQNIVWSPNSNKAIIEFPDGSNVTYDFTLKKQYTLPSSWYDFSFQKDGNKIAFMIDSVNYNERWLSVSSPDGSSFEALEPLGNNADKVIVSYSPNEQMIAMSKTGEPVGTFQQQIIFVGLQGENFKYLNVQGRGFHPIWSPKGDRLIYDAYNSDTSFNPNLWVVNASSDTIGVAHKSLNIATFVSKCGFDPAGIYLYCGVPRSVPAGSGMYPETLDDAGVYDDIYKINIYTGTSSLIAKPIPDVFVESLQVSADGSMIYYKDKRTGNIYNMKLK